MDQITLKDDESHENSTPRFWTAQKQPQLPLVTTPNTTNTSSIRIIKKRVIKPSTVKMLKYAFKSQAEASLQSQYSIIYQLLGRITSIISTSTFYTLSFEDDTENSQNCPLIVPKQTQMTLVNNKIQFSSIQFEENLKDGQPYYRLWVKIVKQDYIVEKFQMVKDYNLILYHRLKIMTSKGVDYQKTSQ